MVRSRAAYVNLNMGPYEFEIDLERTEYEKLGVSETFTAQDVEGLRRLLAKRFHPDSGRDPNAARMTEINNACDILGNPESKARYDAALQTARAVRQEGQRRAYERQAASSPRPPGEGGKANEARGQRGSNAHQGAASANHDHAGTSRAKTRAAAPPPRKTAPSEDAHTVLARQRFRRRRRTLFGVACIVLPVLIILIVQREDDRSSTRPFG